MKSTSKIAGLLAIALLGWGRGALAIEELQPTNIIFGEPGVVYFDATGYNKLFPLPGAIRTFEDEKAYFSFLEAELNAVVTYDEEDKPQYVDLTAITLGQPVFFDKDKREFVDVYNTLTTFLGGESGVIQIASRPRRADLVLAPYPDNLAFFRDARILDLTIKELVAQRSLVHTDVDHPDWKCVVESKAELWIEPSLFNSYLQTTKNACTACVQYYSDQHCVEVACKDADIFLILEIGMVLGFTDAFSHYWWATMPRTAQGFNLERLAIEAGTSSRDSSRSCHSATAAEWIATHEDEVVYDTDCIGPDAFCR